MSFFKTAKKCEYRHPASVSWEKDVCGHPILDTPSLCIQPLCPLKIERLVKDHEEMEVNKYS